MKTILVPTDFSDAAKNAADYAALFTKATDARMILLNVYHYPVPIPPEGGVPIVTTTFFEEASEAALKKEALRLKEKTGIEITTTSRMGLAVDEILDEESKADLIIMGMHGVGIVSETLLGSITTSVIKKTKKPVLIVPDKAMFHKPEKIVLACDYDPKTDAHALDVLKELTLKFQPSISIVNVKPEREKITVSGAISGMQLENELATVDHQYYFPENEDPVEGINEFVKNHKTDLIVTIPHRYNIFERLFHKSISKKLAFHTEIPMLALPDTHKSTAAIFV